jgi:glycosyltransferase involved in cell wall biosynthesis
MKVTVVTPSFNQGRFIGRTLASVASQSGADIEHLVMDGASTDETLALLRQTSSPVRWQSEPDRGQAHAVNKGLHAGSGEIIGWLNSDDIYYPGAIAQVVAYFAANPQDDVVYGMADHIDLDDHAFERYPTQPWNLERLKQYCFICQPALFLRRRVVERYGYLDESLHYCMDYEYWMRLGCAGARFGYIEHKLAGSRLYAENKTLASRLPVHAEINGMLKEKLGRVPARWLVNYAFASAQSRGSHGGLAILGEALRAARRWNGGIKGIGWDLVREMTSLGRLKQEMRAGRSASGAELPMP